MKEISKFIPAFLCATVVSCPFFASASNQDDQPVLGELAQRAQYQRKFSEMFMAEQYDALEKLADGYRANQSRSVSGVWMLSLLYSGICNVTCKDFDAESMSKNASKLKRWSDRYPRSPTPLNAYAYLIIEDAWQFRGSRSARDVSNESWKPFYEKLAAAREYLISHKSIASADPKWYEDMLIIARGEGWDRSRFDALVKEAVERHPYFYEIYFTAIDYLTPKWYGSAADIERFANFAVEHTRAREGMGLYARIYWAASTSYYQATLFESDIDWEKMKRGIDDVLARYPDQWNINNFAYFACLSGDKSKTRELIHRVSGSAEYKVWARSSPDFFERCKMWVTSSARLVYSDAELSQVLTGSWKEIQRNESEMIEQDIRLSSDGSFEWIKVRRKIKGPQLSKRTSRGNWGVVDSVFWYVITGTDYSDRLDAGNRREQLIISVSTDEWVMAPKDSKRRFHAYRTTE